MRALINRFLRDESGVTAIEYGLIASLVGVAAIVGMTSIGTALQTKFAAIATSL
ncbi:MAG: pilus assembly protein [Rhodospirillales bacterium]|jgi:pilus assembly protein Flp/PilA|nr:pilus assembly protein [Rhodospirillales bacterium]